MLPLSEELGTKESYGSCPPFKVPCPETHKPIRLTDSEVGASYIEFPEDTFFLESLAQNPAFRPGVAYVPAQRLVNGQEVTHLYEIRPGYTEAKHVAGPIAAPDGSTDVTVFGSALTSTGILYLCAFNRNSIIVMDLKQLPELPKPVQCFCEVPGLASPNDVCIDPQNEKILFVAGGTFRRFCCCGKFSNSAFGKVYKITMTGESGTDYEDVSIQAQGLKTLAGIEVFNSDVWIAQLFDILRQNNGNSGSEPCIAWKGIDENGDVWLADNIDVFDDNVLLCPAYSTVPAGVVDKIMKRTFVLSAAIFYSQVSTSIMRGERFRQAILDPEVSLSFSNTYIKEGVEPAPVRLIFLKPDSPRAAYHFEIDLVDTRAKNESRTIQNRDKTEELGKRHYFNEQVTHAAHLKGEDGKGYVVCVNFEQPRILLFSDQAFRDALA